MSSKFNLDKYYTQEDVVDYCVSKVEEVVGVNFDVVIEPSAGGGAFINKIEETFKCSEKVYLDVEPTSELVMQQDYLEFSTEHLKDCKTLVIGNPPFGTRNTLSVKFFKKSVTYAEVIAFILPISQLNNNQQMFEFDLISSTDLGKRSYTNDCGLVRDVHCCFNIYKRPNGGLNTKKKYKYSNFSIREVRHTSKCSRERLEDYGEGICAWGSVGVPITEGKSYTQEFYFSGDREIIDFCMNFDWMSVCSKTASPRLMQWQVYEEVLKRFELFPS